MSGSLWPHGLYPTRLLCPWDSPGKIPGVGGHFLLQRIFPTQGSNAGLPHCRQVLYCLSHQGSPRLGDFTDAGSLMHPSSRMGGWLGEMVRGGLTLLPHVPSSSFCEAQLACSPSSVSREKEIHKCFFKVLHVLCFLWSCDWVGHTAKLRVSVGRHHSREWMLRGRCGARNAVTPPELGTDRGASCQLPVVGRTFLPHIPLRLLLLL